MKILLLNSTIEAAEFLDFRDSKHDGFVPCSTHPCVTIILVSLYGIFLSFTLHLRKTCDEMPKPPFGVRKLLLSNELGAATSCDETLQRLRRNPPR